MADVGALQSRKEWSKAKLKLSFFDIFGRDFLPFKNMRPEKFALAKMFKFKEMIFIGDFHFFNYKIKFLFFFRFKLQKNHTKITQLRKNHTSRELL